MLYGYRCEPAQPSIGASSKTIRSECMADPGLTDSRAKLSSVPDLLTTSVSETAWKPDSTVTQGQGLFDQNTSEAATVGQLRHVFPFIYFAQLPQPYPKPGQQGRPAEHRSELNDTDIFRISHDVVGLSRENEMWS